MTLRSAYRLVGPLHIVIPCKRQIEIFRAIQSDRCVAYTKIGDMLEVSTVFTVYDHGFEDGDPLVFETGVFSKGEAVTLKRCSTWTDAENVHRRAVDWCIAQLSPPAIGKAPEHNQVDWRGRRE